jgi:hypothetical protein
MPDIKAYANGAWSPSVGPPGVLTKGITTTTFSRGAASAWVDNDAGGWTKHLDLVPAAPVLTATNNSGRMDLSWTVTSTSNINKYEVYYSTNGTTYNKWSTEPAFNETSAVFGRAASAPSTYYFFIRSVALNGLYADSNVSSVSIGGVTAWSTLTHSRAASGWHTRSFTFTAGVSTSTSTISNVAVTLYWRQNTSQAWSVATSYSENASSMTKTFSFSAYTYGQRMFRVDMVATDNQTKQNDGSTGTGYQFSNSWTTSDLTAADITGGVPIISGSAPTVSDPGSPPADTNRSLTFAVGFAANVDRSEYDSANLYLYRSSDNAYISHTSIDLTNLKSNQTIQQTVSHTFTGLAAGTGYYARFNVYDDEGADRSIDNSQTTYALQSGSYTYISGYVRTPSTSTYDAGHPFWQGNGTEYIGDAPYGPQYTSSKDSLRDGNNNTWYLTTSMGTSASSTTYQRIRVYKFSDYSINNSSQYGLSTDPGYKLNWIEYQTPQTHSIYAEVYDYKAGLWLGYAGTDRRWKL